MVIHPRIRPRGLVHVFYLNERSSGKGTTYFAYLRYHASSVRFQRRRISRRRVGFLYTGRVRDLFPIVYFCCLMSFLGRMGLGYICGFLIVVARRGHRTSILLSNS